MVDALDPIISDYDDSVIVSLFPYQIKDRNLFYDRDHPKNLNPNSMAYSKYWSGQMKKSIEGHWVYDKKPDSEIGTWVYMPGKLHWFTNIAKIEDKKRRRITPRLRDQEWIIFYYNMISDGFSGFEKDDEITCHYLVRIMENDPDELDKVQRKQIPKSAYKSDGELKKFMYPWEYLTRYYLIENPPSEDLGHPLFDNGYMNFSVLSARGIGKSQSMFVGDFSHEFTFNGKKRMNDDVDMNGRLNFGMGCLRSKQLQRSISNISSFFNNMPGKFKFPKRDGDKSAKISMGPFYKRTQGSWKVGQDIEHIVKRKDNTREVEGNVVQMVALTVDKNTIMSGDRARTIYVEEVGFSPNIEEIWAASLDSLRIGNEKVGSMKILGTGGELESIKGSKNIFENPEAYDLASLPNYWKNINKRIGLFIPRYYADENYKDENGNTMIKESYDAVMRKREKDRIAKSSVAYNTDIMFNPVSPDEMLRPSSGGWLPKQEAAEQLSTIESWDIFEKRAMVGMIDRDLRAEKGVEFKIDMNDKYIPILEWNVDMSKTDLDGAVVIYEQPPEKIPDNLYWVIYDPAAKSGEGESLHSIIVYKGFYSGSEQTMQDTIVAEWIGRLEKLDDNYELVVRIAKYFNALIFPEINVAGFVEYMGRKELYYMLERDAYLLEKEINPNGKRSYYKVGFRMDHRKKLWCLKKLRDWLMEPKEYDATTGIPTARTMNHILSPRILNEIINHNDTDNFDHISSLLGLMLLVGKIDKEEIEVKDDYENDNFEQFLDQQNIKPPRRRSTFLDY